MQRLSARFRPKQFFLCKTMRRSFFPKFTELCMETPCWCPFGWAPTWRPETDRNSGHWVLLQKRKFTSRGTQKHQNNSFSNTRTVQIAKFSEISHSLSHSLTRKSCNCRVTQKLGNSSVVYYKTKSPSSSFQLLLFIIKVKYREDQKFCSLIFQ